MAIGGDVRRASRRSSSVVFDCVFNLAALRPAYPIKRRRARREHRHPEASKTGRGHRP